MNTQETIELLHALKAVGAIHFKSQYLEVDLLRNGQETYSFNIPDVPLPLKEPEPPPPAYNAEATKRAQDLIDLLKKKDEEIVNTIFPDGAF